MEESDKSERNPCTYKQQCRHCNICEIKQRPEMCEEIECEHYKPCSKCGRNTNLNENNVCHFCIKRKKSQTIVRKADGSTELVETLPPTNWKIKEKQSKNKSKSKSKYDDDKIGERTLEKSEVSVTPPGTPPGNYSEDEVKYYYSQWEQYSGYYRDPTAYAIAHNIIILEIEMNWLSSFMVSVRGEYLEDLEKKRNRLISNLKNLRDQLPEKEAMELSDDEKSLAVIYEKYIEEKNKRELINNVKQIISPEAIALAPVLYFNINLQTIMERLGYPMQTIMEVTEKHIDSSDLPEDPHELAEALGFPLREKFALSDDINNSENQLEIEEIVKDEL